MTATVDTEIVSEMDRPSVVNTESLCTTTSATIYPQRWIHLFSNLRNSA